MTEMARVHAQAMDAAEEALLAERRGDADTAARLQALAFDLEHRVAQMAIETRAPEPTRSVLLRSAATLALRCGELQAARELVDSALAGNPPSEIADELRDLRAAITSRTDQADGRGAAEAADHKTSDFRSAPMPPATTDSYLEFLAPIIEYSVDSMPEKPLHIGGIPVGTLNEQVFVSELYACHTANDIEARLVRHMLEVAPVGCLAGARGSGKTSAIRFAIYQLKKSHPKVEVVLIDMKRLADMPPFSSADPDDAIIRSLHHVIREHLLSRIFPGDNARRFFAWIMAGQPDETDRFDGTIVDDLFDASQIILGLSHNLSLPDRRLRCEHLDDWFLKHEDDYAELFERFASKLRIAHVLLGATRLSNRDRLVVVYDNVDRLSARHQPLFLEVLNDCHNALGARVGTLVAIRTENIRGATPRPGQGGDTLNVIEMTATLPGKHTCPGLMLPVVSAQHVTEVLQKRRTYGESLYLKHAKTEDIDDARAICAGVAGQMLDAAIHRLANNSMRSVVNIYSDFTRHLSTLRQGKVFDKPEVEASTEDNEGHLRTVFFLWLFEEGRGYHVEVPDILSVRSPLANTGDIPARASAHYFLITCVLNLVAERAQQPYGLTAPEFREVWARMSELDFTLPQVRGALRELCAPPGEQARVLEFYQTEEPIGQLNEESTARLRDTVGGREFITKVCTMVGYVWGRAHQFQHARIRRAPAYFAMPPDERVEILYDYIEPLARAELGLLKLIRAKWYTQHGVKWLDDYRDWFGLSRQLHVERVLESARAFYKGRYATHVNPFGAMLEAYKNLVQQIAKDGTLVEDDMASLARGREAIKPGMSPDEMT